MKTNFDTFSKFLQLGRGNLTFTIWIKITTLRPLTNIQELQGIKYTVPLLSGGGTSGWKKAVSPNFPLIREAHLTVLTLHNSSSISAVQWGQHLVMLQLLSLAKHRHPDCAYMNSPLGFSLVWKQIKQRRPISLVKSVKFLLWLAAHLIRIFLFFILFFCCCCCLSNEQSGLHWTCIYYY